VPNYAGIAERAAAGTTVYVPLGKGTARVVVGDDGTWSVERS
jgi:hypothetical protein